MKILVYVKQVPDTDDVAIDPKTGRLRREGVESVLNPLDLNGIEAALQLKEKYGGTVCAVSMGPPQAMSALKKALGMGCDEAFLLSDRAFGGADTLATAYTLAKAAEKIGDYDLLIFGRHAVDGDTAQTGPAVAAWMGLPQITLASSMDVQDGWVYCDRILGEKRQKVRAKLPAVVTVVGDINQPRYATPINIMRAQKKPQTMWGSADMNCDNALCGTPGSPTSTKKLYEPERRSANTVYFKGELADMAKGMADALEAEHII